jgi:hypothetical protein
MYSSQGGEEVSPSRPLSSAIASRCRFGDHRQMVDWTPGWPSTREQQPLRSGAIVPAGTLRGVDGEAAVPPGVSIARA